MKKEVEFVYIPSIQWTKKTKSRANEQVTIDMTGKTMKRNLAAEPKSERGEKSELLSDTSLTSR